MRSSSVIGAVRNSRKLFVGLRISPALSKFSYAKMCRRGLSLCCPFSILVLMIRRRYHPLESIVSGIIVKDHFPISRLRRRRSEYFANAFLPVVKFFEPSRDGLPIPVEQAFSSAWIEYSKVLAECCLKTSANYSFERLGSLTNQMNNSRIEKSRHSTFASGRSPLIIDARQ